MKKSLIKITIMCAIVVTCIVSDNVIHIVRPELGERYSICLKGNQLSILSKFPHVGKNSDYNIIVKIGLINNNDILNIFARTNGTNLTSLLSYVRNSNRTRFIVEDGK